MEEIDCVGNKQSRAGSPKRPGESDSIVEDAENDSPLLQLSVRFF
jgi:hypothetical protein